MGSCFCLCEADAATHKRKPSSDASSGSQVRRHDSVTNTFHSDHDTHVQIRGNLLVCSIFALSFALFRFQHRSIAFLLFFVGCIVWCSWLMWSPDSDSLEVTDNDLGTMCDRPPLDLPLPKNDEGVSFSFRVSDKEAAQIRARGEDPHIGLRLNYLGGTSVPFEPLLKSLKARERSAFEKFQRIFPPMLNADARVQRSMFYQEPDNFTMLLFLQADNYNIDLAAERLIATIAWRQSGGLDDFIDNPDMELYSRYLKYRAKRMVGFDKCGRPLIIERLGELFGSDNGERAMTREEWAIGSAFELALVSCAFRRTSVHENRAIHRLTYIGDLSGMRIMQTKNLVPFLQFVTQCVERHFPECAGSVMLVNAPIYVTTLLKLVSVFIPSTVMANLSVHSDIPYGFLRDKIGPRILPREWGGDSHVIVPHIPSLLEQ